MSTKTKTRVVWSVEWRTKSAKPEGYKQFSSEAAARRKFESLKKAGKPCRLGDESSGFCRHVVDDFDYDRAPLDSRLKTDDGICAKVGENVWVWRMPKDGSGEPWQLIEVPVRAFSGHAWLPSRDLPCYWERKAAIKVRLDRTNKQREKLERECETLLAMLDEEAITTYRQEAT